MPAYQTATAVLALSVLVGCSDHYEAQAVRAVAEGQQESATCAAFLRIDPRFKPIAAHMPLDGGPATPIQLADSGTPPKAMTALIAAWQKELVRCRQPTQIAIGVAAPDAVPVIALGYDTSDAVLAALAHGTMTWGEANRNRDAVVAANTPYLQGAIAQNQQALATQPDAVLGLATASTAQYTVQQMQPYLSTRDHPLLQEWSAPPPLRSP